jgi:hypothetical protein
MFPHYRGKSKPTVGGTSAPMAVQHMALMKRVLAPRMTPTEKENKKPRTYSKDELVTLKQTLKDIGGRVIDKRTTLGKSLAKWRDDLITDLGGADEISTQQSALVDLAVKSKLLLNSIDAWLLTQPTLVNARKRSLLTVVLQRQTLADGLARYLTQSTIRNILAPMRGMYNQAIEDGKPHINPGAMMGKFNKKDAGSNDKKINPLTREETQILLDKAERDLMHYYPLFLCAPRTGIREGELNALKGSIWTLPTD